jgi:hypothetical protein
VPETIADGQAAVETQQTAADPAVLPAPNPRRFGDAQGGAEGPGAVQRARGAITNLFGGQ